MTTGVACPVPILQFFNNAGQPCANGSLLTQVGGVNTATYQDSALSTPLPNPIPLNSRGEVSSSTGATQQIFLTPNTVYTFTLSDANGNQLWVANYVNGIQLNQQSVAALLWPQTAAEASNTVTPSNYDQTLIVDIERYGGGVSASASANNTALSTALTVLTTAGGGILRFNGVGTYQFSTTFTIPSYVILQGGGPTTYLAYSGTGTFISIPGGNGRVSIRDLVLIGPGGSSTTTFANLAGVGLSLGSTGSNASIVRVQNVSINGFSTGMRIAGLTWATFDNVEFGGPVGGAGTYSNGYGIVINFSSGANVNAVSWRNCTISNNALAGVSVQAVPAVMYNLQWLNCVVQNNCYYEMANPGTYPTPDAQWAMGTAAGVGVSGFSVDCMYMEYTFTGNAPDYISLGGLGQGYLRSIQTGGTTGTINYCMHDRSGNSMNQVTIEDCQLGGTYATAAIYAASENDVLIRNISCATVTAGATGGVTLTGNGCTYIPAKSSVQIATTTATEASFTPAISGLTGSTLGAVNGIYSQIGQVVTFAATLAWSTASTGVTALSITGLPVAAKAGGPGALCQFSVSSMAASFPTGTLIGTIAAGTSVINLQCVGTLPGGLTNLIGTMFGSSGYVTISGSYQV